MDLPRNWVPSARCPTVSPAGCRHVPLGQPQFLGTRAINVDMQFRLVERPAECANRQCRELCASFSQQFFRIDPVGVAIEADDLHIERGRQAEIQDLTDDVGRQECKGRFREIVAGISRERLT